MALTLVNRFLVVLFYCLLVYGWFHEVSDGAVYKVGDDAGWTTIGNVNYRDWASNKIFQLNDTIIFEYNPLFHNVMQVTHLEYRTCSVSSPISTLATGNDTITITTHGHHFYVCGAPGHCQLGQKVDINVVPAAVAATAPHVSISPSVSTVPTAPAVPPISRNYACIGTDMPFGKFGWVMLQLMLVFCLGGV
ncbi:hypothetical protein OROGR_014295 [Orobanche gracilis]